MDFEVFFFSLLLIISLVVTLSLAFRMRSATKEIARANRKLRDRVEMYQSLLDGLPIAAFAINQEGEVLECNRIFRELTNEGITNVRFSAETALPMGTTSLQSLKEFCENLRSISGVHYQDLHLSFGGLEQDIYFWAIPFYENQGAPAGRICGWLDISERVRLEDALRHAKMVAEQSQTKVEEASKVKSTFLSNISHEIRTPLNVIIGSLEIGLLHRDSAPGAGKGPQAKAMALKAAQHLLALIDDILDFSKAEANKLVLHPSPVRLADVLAEVGQLYEMQLSSKGIEFVNDLTAIPQTLWVTLDALRLKQIITNLLSNAAKFTPKHGQVCLRGGLVSGQTAHSVKIEIEVSDTGIGIATADQAGLFQPFSQAEHGRLQTQQVNLGTGLGLAICRQLVELMGGKITLQSVLDHGTTVQVLIEAELCDEPRAVPFESEIATQQSHWARKVLIVDDHLLNLTVLEAQFQQLGCDVTQASSGEEALALLTAGEGFDLIVTDYSMPGMSGPELAARVRTHEQSNHIAHTRMIGLTAFTQSEYRNAAIAAGMDDCLHKPVTIAGWARILGKKPVAMMNKSTVNDVPATQAQDAISLDGIKVITLEDKQKEVVLLRNVAAACTADWQDVQNACGQNSWGTLLEKIHRLRSMTNMFGFTALGERCLAVEQIVKNEKFAALNQAMTNAEQQLHALLAAIQERLNCLA